MIRQLDIPASQWRHRDLTAVRNILTHLGTHPELCRQWRGTAWLTFSDTEVDEPMILPKIRQFVLDMYNEFPHALYFLSPDARAGSLLQLTAALSDPANVKHTASGVQVQVTEEVLAMAELAIGAAARFAVQIGDDWVAAVSDTPSTSAAAPCCGG